MSNVLTSTISQNLHHKPAPKFINVGPGQTYAYGGTGSGVTFNVHGSSPYGFANAHLDLTFQGPGFVGTVDLGKDADVLVSGMHATSYSYDKIGDHLKLYSGSMLIDELTINTGGRGVTVSDLPAVSSSNRGGALISTGRLEFGGGVPGHVLPVHVG